MSDMAAVCHRLYSTLTASTFTSTLLNGFEDFKTRRQLIRTVKCADELVLLARAAAVLQSTINTLTEPGRCYGAEINVGETKVMRFDVRVTVHRRYYVK
jgi:hypothetical protein